MAYAATARHGNRQKEDTHRQNKLQKLAGSAGHTPFPCSDHAPDCACLSGKADVRIRQSPQAAKGTRRPQAMYSACVQLREKAKKTHTYKQDKTVKGHNAISRRKVRHLNLLQLSNV